MATMELDEPGTYGRVIRDGDGSVLRVAEAKTAGDATAEELEIREVNTGVYAFDGGALVAALATLDSDNAQGELYLPDVLPAMRAAGRMVAAHPIGDPDLTHGVDDRVDLAYAQQVAQRRILEEHMRSGVTIVDPGSTRIDATVTIGRDTVIEPFAQLKGAHDDRQRHPHRRDEHADRHPGRRRRDDPALAPHAGARGRRRHRRPVRLPAARRPPAPERPRPAPSWRSRTPRSAPAPRSRTSPTSATPTSARAPTSAPATSPPTTTASNKHRTTIGSNVKTSVDTTFVAPVTVGDRAYTGAGTRGHRSTSRPARSRIARGRQKNIEGYADRKDR